jgi:hypothetical protein
MNIGSLYASIAYYIWAILLTKMVPLCEPLFPVGFSFVFLHRVSIDSLNYGKQKTITPEILKVRAGLSNIIPFVSKNSIQIFNII